MAPTRSSRSRRSTRSQEAILEANELTDPNPRRRPGAGHAGRQGEADPDPEAHPEADGATTPSSGARRSGARPVLRRHLRLAGRRWRQLHQPVLPLRPLRHRHRRGLRDSGSVPPPPARSSSPAGRATAAATRSGSPTAATCTRRTTTCRRVRRQRGQSVSRASRSGGSARPATRPGRTSTSRSGGPGLERRLGSTRSITSSPLSPGSSRRPAEDPVGRPPPHAADRARMARCSSTE
jgi:hypothetical protein